MREMLLVGDTLRRLHPESGRTAFRPTIAFGLRHALAVETPEIEVIGECFEWLVGFITKGNDIRP